MSELTGRGSSGERRASVATSAPRPWLMLGVVVAWGSCFVAIRWGLRYAPALWFATLRAALAGGLLVAVGVLRGGRLPRGRGAWLTLLALGLVNVAFAFGAMFTGVANVSATGVAAVLANAQPLLILLPAWALYGERAAPTAVVGVAVGFAGLLFIAIPGGGGTGAWLSLLSAGSITAGTLLARRPRVGQRTLLWESVPLDPHDRVCRSRLWRTGAPGTQGARFESLGACTKVIDELFQSGVSWAPEGELCAPGRRHDRRG